MADQADKLRDLASQARNAPKKASPAQAPAPLPGTYQPQLARVARARVITVSSGKGGVGKTNLSVNLSLALRRLGKEVLLFDADLGLANADVLLGMSPRYNLMHFFQGQKSLKECMSEGPLGLKVIGAGNGIAQMADLGAQERERLLSHFSLLEEGTDFIVVDTGAGISRNVVSFAQAADECLVVTTPEPTARLDAYGLIKVLNQDGYQGAVRLVVNMAESEQEGNEAGRLMETLAKRFLGAHVEYFGFVPIDRSVRKAVSRQEAFTIAYPDSQASKAVAGLAARLCDRSHHAAPGGLKGFLEKLGVLWGNKP